MKSENTPEWLPSGWTLHTNVLKTGRKIEYYLNSETGQKFFSKDDLIHHVRVQGIEIGHSQPSKRKFESDSQNQLQIDVVRDIHEPPDWLPDTWIMEEKNIKSGGRKGKTYKCFVEVATGRKCYSKPEVFKHLKKVRCGSSKMKVASIRALPSRKVGSSEPKEASIIAEPLRKVGSSKQKEAFVSTQPLSKVVFEKCRTEDLPPGWVKVVKITESANRTRKDPFYTDPDTGYVFRSRKDVERYLATGKMSRSAFLPKKRLFTDQDMPSSAIDRDMKVGIPAMAQFLSGEHRVDDSSKCEKVSDIIVLEQPVAVGTQDRKKVDTDEGTGLTYKSDKKQQQDWLKDAKESGFQHKTQSNLSKSKTKKGLNLPRRTSKRLAGVEPILEVDPVSRVIDSNMEVDLVYSLNEHNDAANNPVSIAEALQDPALACSNEDSIVSVSADGPILNSEADTKQEIIENKTKERSDVKANNDGSSKATKRKIPNLPRRSSKRLAGLGPEPLADSVSAEHASQNATTSSRDHTAIAACPNSDDLLTEVYQQHETKAAERREKVSLQEQPSQMMQIHEQDVLKEQSERLVTDKIIDKISEPKISPPFEEFLADPCLEFAYKTLTGATPFENAAYSMLFENPANIVNQKVSHVNGVEEDSNRKTQTKSRKRKNGKESASHRSSKQKAGFQFNPMSSSISLEISVDTANVKSGKAKAVRRSGSARKNVEGSQKVGISPGSAHVHHGSPGVKISQDWRVNKSKQSLHYLKFCGNHSQKAELPPIFPSMGELSQLPEPQSTFLAGDFWSDPCLEFAFKTLTGSLPVEDHLQAPGYFQQQVSSLQPQRESYFQQPFETYPSQRDGNMALPEFSFPSFSQTDISAHFESPEKQPAPSSNMSVLPSGNVNMPSCGSIASQSPHIDGNKGLHGKVKS